MSLELDLENWIGVEQTERTGGHFQQRNGKVNNIHCFAI
jgi:hypothetical protein